MAAVFEAEKAERRCLFYIHVASAARRLGLELARNKHWQYWYYWH